MNISMSVPDGCPAEAEGNLRQAAALSVDLFESCGPLSGMDIPADFAIDDADGTRTAVFTGDWTAHCLGDAAVRLRAALAGARGSSAARASFIGTLQAMVVPITART